MERIQEISHRTIKKLLINELKDSFFIYIPVERFGIDTFAHNIVAGKARCYDYFSTVGHINESILNRFSADETLNKYTYLVNSFEKQKNTDNKKIIDVENLINCKIFLDNFGNIEYSNAYTSLDKIKNAPTVIKSLASFIILQKYYFYFNVNCNIIIENPKIGMSEKMYKDFKNLLSDYECKFIFVN